MAAMKTPSSFLSKAVTFLLVIMVIAAYSPSANSQSQNCAAVLSELAVCAPFVVPSAGGSLQNPSSQCCNALKGANHDCLCNTYSIISKLPNKCNLSPVSCSA